MKRRRGLSLVELLVALTVLSLASGVAFLIFDLGTRWFRTLLTQQGLEAQLRRFSAVARRDLETTNAQGLLTVTNRTTLALGQNRDRHALCMPTVSDWAGPSAYDANSGLPNWDRYLLYYAELDESGQLLRCRIDPPGGVFAAGPLLAFENNPTAHLPANPTLIPDYESHRIVAEDVLEFSVQKAGSQKVVLDLKLSLEAEQPASKGRRRELRELRLEVTARNTFPLL